MKTSVIGFPRIGELRELKFATEKYWRGELSEQQLQETAKALREKHWRLQKETGIDGIPSNDFSFYDSLLDTAVLFNIIPERYRKLSLSGLDTYFAMARGYQGKEGDVKALAMKKWFNTNYHYMVPECEDDTVIRLAGTKPVEEYREAKALGIQTKVTVIGAFTLLKLIRFTGNRKAEEIATSLAGAYRQLLAQLAAQGAEWIQLEEPYLVRDLTDADIALFEKLYEQILSGKGNCKVLLQTYFGDVRDVYQKLDGYAFDAVGLDFVEGRKNMELVRQYGFPKDKLLVAGLINGKNIWKNHYADTLAVLKELKNLGIRTVLGTSCSLLHVPYTLRNETKLPEQYKSHFSFAEEKLWELRELSDLTDVGDLAVIGETAYAANEALFRNRPDVVNADVQKRVSQIADSDYTRLPVFEERERIQKEVFGLPLFPTTTIGSFPQTRDVKQNRNAFRKGEITEEQYKEFNT
ncbi:MAG: 5-methyltetrahydropteroyltriglutamate--homocysteine S-methyltransferase, partial [Lachnospiraceae bacterium]|nr:5-methyltetrahydropteroyltriglutamate--homocysteine S-methyltransferase [Lachnospiraceae bacterium]